MNRLTLDTSNLYTPGPNVISNWLAKLSPPAPRDIQPVRAMASYPRGLGCYWESWQGAVYTDHAGIEAVMLTWNAVPHAARVLPIWWKAGTRTCFRTTHGEKLYVACFATNEALRDHPEAHPGVLWFQLRRAPDGMNFSRYLNLSLYR